MLSYFPDSIFFICSHLSPRCLSLSLQGSHLLPLHMGTLDGNSRHFPPAAASPAFGLDLSRLSSRGSQAAVLPAGLQQGPLQPSMNPTPSTAPHLPCPAGQFPEAGPGEDRLWSKFNSLNPPNLPTSSPPWVQGTVKYPSPPYSVIVACCGYAEPLDTTLALP